MGNGTTERCAARGEAIMLTDRPYLVSATARRELAGSGLLRIEGREIEILDLARLRAFGAAPA